MMNLRQQTVTVDRLKLIAALQSGLEAHRIEYAEAKADYIAAVKKFMSEANERAQAGDFTNLVLRLTKPDNREKDYTNVIEMLEESVSETIQLDSDTFRAYYKGEWSWKGAFEASASSLKSYLSGGIGGFQ